MVGVMVWKCINKKHTYKYTLFFVDIIDNLFVGGGTLSLQPSFQKSLYPNAEHF